MFVVSGESMASMESEVFGEYGVSAGSREYWLHFACMDYSN